MASILDAKVQSYIALYSGIISTLSPSLTTLQLLKTFDRSISAKELATISVRIFPHQCFLKWAQMNAATPVKEHANPWLAFGVVGVLQGGYERLLALELAPAGADARLARVDLLVVVPRVIEDGRRLHVPGLLFGGLDVHFVVLILQILVPEPVVAHLALATGFHFAE